jgi:UDP-2,3-diacylglucosamine hydrolase
MSHTLFISDLHLTPDRPRASELFFDFISHIAPRAESRYVLGVLFE